MYGADDRIIGMEAVWEGRVDSGKLLLVNSEAGVVPWQHTVKGNLHHVSNECVSEFRLNFEWQIPLSRITGFAVLIFVFPLERMDCCRRDRGHSEELLGMINSLIILGVELERERLLADIRSDGIWCRRHGVERNVV
jgi:hypothetical protein